MGIFVISDSVIFHLLQADGGVGINLAHLFRVHVNQKQFPFQLKLVMYTLN